MDLGFFRRGMPAARDGAAAQLDYRLLTAALQAYQSASPAARAQMEDSGGLTLSGRSPLVEILLGGPGWKEAVRAQKGSFNAAWIGRGGDG